MDEDDGITGPHVSNQQFCSVVGLYSCHGKPWLLLARY